MPLHGSQSNDTLREESSGGLAGLAGSGLVWSAGFEKAETVAHDRERRGSVDAFRCL